MMIWIWMIFWRNLRRFAALKIFSSRRLQMSSNIRMEEIRFLTKQLFKSSIKGIEKVEIKSAFNILAFNIIMKMLTGNRYFEDDDLNSDETRHRLDDIKQTFSPSRQVGLGGFPFLRWCTFREARQMKKLYRKRDLFLKAMIDARRNIRSSSSIIHGERRSIIIDTMLSLQELEPEFYTDDIIKGMIMTLLTAGTDTSAVTMEWAMSLLLNHPTVLDKVKTELDCKIGHQRLVEEPDLSDLPYLRAIVNETLRLFPAAPLLVAHESSDDCSIGGYDVRGGTMLLVNAWAIHRDAKVWEDPTSFRPERFEGGEGEACRFIPFGLGRRGCPGAGLANRVMGLALAALVQCFEWQRVGEVEVDMSEGKGLTMPKAQPLEAMCRARNSMIKVLSEL
ncbi:hypothetical protein VitviT2T_027499 [Vitis vinifera]|uniref:Cytochrome P450 81E8 n=1 Tax=Vitis vinifera TaxID=29760 RepID=A0ABY9DQ46_VITVI|nr:hypothetical protein VitviT2T_027499 [Vitis vinifera]